jgi:hypothetical protein
VTRQLLAFSRKTILERMVLSLVCLGFKAMVR